MNRYLKIGASILFASILATLLPVSAQAAPAALPPMPPGDGWQYGVELKTFFKPCGTVTTAPGTGGWSDRTYHSESRVGSGGLWKRPVSLRLMEPCSTLDGTTTQLVGVALQLRAMATGFSVASPNPGNCSVDWCSAAVVAGEHAGAGTPPGFTGAVCSSQQWSKPGTNQTPYTLTNGSSAFGQNTVAATGTVQTGNYGAWNGIGATVSSNTCKYIVTLSVSICELDKGFIDLATTPTGHRTCYGAQWNAQQAALEAPYTDARQTPEELACQHYGAQADCAFIDPNIDGSTAVVCENPPPFLWSGDWLDFSWVPASLQHVGALFVHYGRCLFVPIGGFDEGAWISSAWEASAAGEVASAASSAALAYQWGESCGVIGSGSGSTFGNVVINTCAWSAWATPIRVILGWGILIAGGWFILQFVWSTAMSVINRKMPAPMAEAEHPTLW